MTMLAAVSAFGQSGLGIDSSWLPVSGAERELKAPLVEPDAGVEAIFWRVHVLDDVLGGRELQRVLYHYVRLKIFNEQGKTKVATIDIPFSERESIMDVAGRTIKADGTELELKKASIFERDRVRVGGFRFKVKSFAMPGVEPGSIVEYRWREIRHDPNSLYMRLQFQLEYPAQKITYFVRPLPSRYTTYRMAVWPFNCKPSPLKLENNDFNSISLENVSAFREEPMMPGEPNVRPWVLVLYTDGKRREPDTYWNDIGKNTYNDYLKPALKVNDEIKQAAAKATAGATTDEQKVIALIRYIRANMRDLYSPQVTEAERAKIVKDLMSKDRFRTSAEVFKSGIGEASELNTLFAAMASQVGLDARPAMLADRDDMVFHPSMTDRYFLRNIDMAVNIGGNWKLYDISARRLPPGMLSWREEGMKVLLSDSKKPFFIDSPLSPPSASRSVRSAKLTLDEDGNIEGDIEEAFSGHAAYFRRLELGHETDAKKQESLKERIAKVFSEAEVSDLRLENADDAEKALAVHYHVKISGYAQHTGKRLLLQPLFFQRGATPLFASSERRYPVVFPYAWNEHDVVTIALPAGYSLDNADQPASLSFGKPGAYSLSMAMKGQRELICSRDLTFGNEGFLAFDREIYPKLKNVFDEIHLRDNHTIVLKQSGAGGAQ